MPPSLPDPRRRGRMLSPSQEITGLLNLPALSHSAMLPVSRIRAGRRH